MVGSAGVNSVVSVALVSITGRYYSAIGIISDAKVIMTSGSNTDKQKNGKHAGFNGRKVSVKPFPPSTSGDICVKMKAIF